ncbi:MAG TPA: thioredoxin-disulfide reductase [Tenuifilaceae bacterium]|nr:thioredoxin-disulfide reductase [Tenuifilaceae bacterium]
MELFKPFESQDKPVEQKAGTASEHVRVLIIGSGPAGYTAAIYAARANLNPVLYEGLQPGGQLTTTTEVDNFPGYPEGINGTEMMEDLKKQAQRFGTDVRFGMATAANLSKQPFSVTIDNEKEVLADALIIATGATAKYLGLESEDKYKGQGVSACATCDGFFYKGQDVAVVGGGDTACEEATYLSGICRKVYMIVRKPYLRASKAMQDRVANTKNIEVLFEHVTKEVVGDDNGVNGVLLENGKGEIVKKDITGFFLAIGHQPNSDIFKEFIETDEVGYIKTIPGTAKTNIEGVFACGDVQDKHYRQAVTAAGSGCMAALDAERYLGNRIF